jgi:hypothetical protein
VFDMRLCDDVTVVVDLIVGFKPRNATVVVDITTCDLRIFGDAVNTYILPGSQDVKSSIVAIFGLHVPIRIYVDHALESCYLVSRLNITVA